MISTSSYIWIMTTFNCQGLKIRNLCGHVHRKVSFHEWLHYQSIQGTKGLLDLSGPTNVLHDVQLRAHLKRQWLLFADKNYRLKYTPSETRDPKHFAEPTSVSVCAFVAHTEEPEEAGVAPR